MSIASDGSGTQNPGFRFWKCSGEMCFRALVELGFSSFFAKNFGIFDKFFSKWSMPNALWNFENSSNMPKICQKLKKGLVQLA